MAQRRNYGFERRRRADAQRAKQEEKRARRAERPGMEGAGPEIGEAQDVGAPSAAWEWFSASRSRTVTTAPGGRPAPEDPDDWILLTDPKDVPAPPGG